MNSSSGITITPDFPFLISTIEVFILRSSIPVSNGHVEDVEVDFVEQTKESVSHERSII